VGLMPQVGFKFGRWLDLAFYQLTLQTPESGSTVDLLRIRSINLFLKG
jgi:hypothetical protein